MENMGRTLGRASTRVTGKLWMIWGTHFLWSVGWFGFPCGGGSADVGTLFEEILQFSCELDACRTTSYNNHVQKAFPLLIRLVFEGSSLDAIHDSFPDLLSISHLLQKAGVFPDAGNSKGGVLSPNSNNKHIERHFSG